MLQVDDNCNSCTQERKACKGLKLDGSDGWRRVGAGVGNGEEVKLGTYLPDGPEYDRGSWAPGLQYLKGD